MSKADKMFEGLGYTKREYNHSIAYSKKWREYDGDIVYVLLNYVTFWLDNKKVKVREETSGLSMQELNAIYEKAKELGW